MSEKEQKNELKGRENINTLVCVTGQHRQMLDQVLDAFNVVPDYDLSIMKEKQTLFDITTNILNSKEIRRFFSFKQFFSCIFALFFVPLQAVLFRLT